MFPAYTAPDGDTIYGIYLLLFGSLGVLMMPWSGFGWFANLFFMYILIQTFKGKRTGIVPLLAMILLSIRCFFPLEIMLDEAGNTATLTEHKLGFYLWFSSIVLLATLILIKSDLLRKMKS